MLLKTITLLWLGLIPLARGHELDAIARGLPLSIEHLDGTVDLNGLPISVSRAIGPAISTLAERVIDNWRAESGADSVRQSQCCGWHFASNIRDSSSRVIQWRSTGAKSELLWSTIDLAQRIPRAPVPSVPLLEGCSWTTPVHGQTARRRFVQVSARCKQDASVLLDRATKTLEGQGWHWRQVSTTTVQAARGLTQAQLIAIPEPAAMGGNSASRSSVVVIESQPSSRVGR